MNSVPETICIYRERSTRNFPVYTSHQSTYIWTNKSKKKQKWRDVGRFFCCFPPLYPFLRVKVCLCLLFSWFEICSFLIIQSINQSLEMRACTYSKISVTGIKDPNLESICRNISYEVAMDALFDSQSTATTFL